LGALEACYSVGFVNDVIAACREEFAHVIREVLMVFDQ
jgi:hypothetical protein